MTQIAPIGPALKSCTTDISVPPTGEGVVTVIPLNELWLSYGHGRLPTRQSKVADYNAQRKLGFVSKKFPKSRLEGHCQHRFLKKKNAAFKLKG